MSEKRSEESFLATVRGGWRVTIPIEVRRKLRVQRGDLVKVIILREVEAEG